MLMLLIRLFAIIMLSTFELITFFWNQGVYTPTLKKHQVVRDLKKFENHWAKAMAIKTEDDLVKYGIVRSSFFSNKYMFLPNLENNLNKNQCLS